MIKPRAAVPFKTSLATAIALAAFASTLATAQPTAYTRPNTTTATGAATVNFSGQNFINHGLQGVSRLSATATRDFNGDTFGAFSALDIVPGSWRKTANGYSGTLFSLPDRGPNGVGSVNFSNYPGRISTFAMAFNPYTSSTNLPVSAASQQQLVLTQTGGFFFRDFSGNLTGSQFEIAGVGGRSTIGGAFGGRDHGTVIHARKTVVNQMEVDPNVRRTVEYLRAQLSTNRA